MPMIFRAIQAKTFQSSIFREETMKAAKEICKDMLDDFKRTTATWDPPAKFSSKVDEGAAVGGVRIMVATDDARYYYVDKGTRPHKIAPKKKKALAFRTSYTPKTTPNVVLSTPGGASGKQIVRKTVVKHPGTKARNFTKIITDSYKPEFRRQMRNAIDRAARRTK